jgi:hypothetical protein
MEYIIIKLSKINKKNYNIHNIHSKNLKEVYLKNNPSRIINHQELLIFRLN